jgi:N-acetylmuramoyl-L-alanine amidase
MTLFSRVASLAAVTLTAVSGVALSAPSFALPAGDAGSIAEVNVSTDGLVPTLAVDERAISAPPLSEAAAAPSAPPVQSLAELVAAQPMPATIDRELECLAASVYFESKSEPLEGQLAVAEVVLNRASSGRFPATVCGVVFQRAQFSFVRGNGFPPIKRGSAAWTKAVKIAQIAMAEQWRSEAAEALFFHANHVRPNWGKTRVATLGNHIFYR